MMVQLHNSMMVRNIESYLEVEFRRESFSFQKRIAQQTDKLFYRFSVSCVQIAGVGAIFRHPGPRLGLLVELYSTTVPQVDFTIVL